MSLRPWALALVGALALVEAAGCGRELSISFTTPDSGAHPDAGETPDAGYGGEGGCLLSEDETPQPGFLRFSEAMSANDGAAIDELGEADDWLELVNVGDAPVLLGSYTLGDSSGDRVRLPNLELGPGETVLFWADEDRAQGSTHLPFRLSSSGDAVFLWEDCALVDRLQLPKLPVNESYARLEGAEEFTTCRYATPGRANGTSCLPPPPPSLPDDVHFEEYSWPKRWPDVTGPLVAAELALRPASFVEVVNVSDDELDLNGYAMRLGPHAPGLPWPTVSDGIDLSWGVDRLAAGKRLVVDVGDSDIAALMEDEAFEGVLTIFEKESGQAIERVDFMRWPSGAALTRSPGDLDRHRFCSTMTAGLPNDECDPVPAREVGDRVRHLRTPGDFEALAAGAGNLGVDPVKFVVDMQAGNVVHLLSSRHWALHYTWIRDKIYGEPPLDRCDPEQSRLFNVGWSTFSQQEYFVVEGRRFLLGTLVHHGPPDLHTVEFALGDRISSEQMRHAFFTVTQHVQRPRLWALRPQDGSQLATMRPLDGLAPVVGPNAPFVDLTFQPLTNAVGFGRLQFVSASELDTTPLGPDVIVVTDDVPNDIQLVGGLVTEAFQTPLAHVNVLSQNRNTPNMGLRDARSDRRLAPFFGKLVRLEVTGANFTVRAASAEEAEEFWESRRPAGPKQVARLDSSRRQIVDLRQVGLDALPHVGAKAAQFAELTHVQPASGGCTNVRSFSAPANAFAIPVVHYLEHFADSGARDRLVELEKDADFRTDPIARAAGLAEVRRLILQRPVESNLLQEVSAAVENRFGDRRVRFRSSSNAEDLPSFNGAGLYTSVSAATKDPERPIDYAMKTVWASLWNQRAYDERQYANIDQRAVAMAILVHEAFLSEKANGVAISRDILDPIRGDIYYVNTQLGEASVTNPAPGIVTEQLIYRRPPRMPPITYQSRSSFTDGEVLSLDEVRAVACALGSVHQHFRPLLDPQAENQLFAMEIEFKFMGADRHLIVKQARPHPFGTAEIPQDCRSL